MPYSPCFLDDQPLNAPFLLKEHALSDTISQLDYTHFSIWFSCERRLPLFTAVNINGDLYKDNPRQSDRWLKDSRLPYDVQTGDEFYTLTSGRFHRGHIVRRLDPCWGTEKKAFQASQETFYFTNSCPQHYKFNPRIWLELERNLLEKGSIAHGEKVVVLSGPVLDPSDRPFIEKEADRKLLIPMQYWKVVVWKKSDARTYAVAFLQPQPPEVWNTLDLSMGEPAVRKLEDQFEKIKFKNGQTYQVPLAEITKITGLHFPFGHVVLPDVPAGGVLLQESRQPSSPSKTRCRGYDTAFTDIVGMVI